jgi:putative hydrolase of the HAD superfamily
VDPSIGWEAFGDAQQALEATAAAGWTNAILSNHVPELPALVAGVGLSTHVDRIFSSAQIGWEKPNPRVFRHALNAYGNPREVWMIGDNPIADIAGAEAVGLRAILVHGADSQEPNGALGLVGAAEIVLGS